MNPTWEEPLLYRCTWTCLEQNILARKHKYVFQLYMFPFFETFYYINIWFKELTRCWWVIIIYLEFIHDTLFGQQKNQPRNVQLSIWFQMLQILPAIYNFLVGINESFLGFHSLQSNLTFPCHSRTWKVSIVSSLPKAKSCQETFWQ